MDRREAPRLKKGLDAIEMGGVVKLLGEGIRGTKGSNEEQTGDHHAHEREETDETQTNLRAESLL